MIDKTLLSLLVCPTSRQPLREATTAELAGLNQAIAAGGAKNRGGTAVTAALQGALATADGAWFYPVQDDIPILLVAEALPRPPSR